MGVVTKEDIVTNHSETMKHRTSEDYLNQLEGSLKILLNNLGVQIDSSIQRHENEKRMDTLRQSRAVNDDRDMNLIQSIENSADVIRPGAHGCSPRHKLNMDDQKTR